MVNEPLSEADKAILQQNKATIRWGVIENIATVAAVVALYWLSHSWWSLVVLLNLNMFKRRK